MNIRTGYGKQVKVSCTDGKVFKGFYCIFTRAGDNEPEIASLTLETPEGLIEILEPEIEAIEVLD